MENAFSQELESVYQALQTSQEGLSHAQAKERLSKYGKNELKSKKKVPLILKFLKQFKDVLIAILIVSMIISIVVGSIEKSVNEFIDAGIIFVVITLNAIIGFWNERKSEKAMQSLKNMTKPYCKVLRGHRSVKIKTENLVVGDIVLLEAGDIIPADLRLIETVSLKIEESALTGESVPVEKDAGVLLSQDVALADQVNMAFMGSVVTYGRGMGVVVATGMDTQMGKIASALSEIDVTTTPLTKRLHRTSLIITGIVLLVCLVVFIVEIATGGKIFNSFSMAIAIAVCAIPEGLPACNTITLSMGVKRMSEQRAIVKTLPAVETLGSTQVICSDKTGTLTLNKMTVRKTFFMSDVCKSVNELDFSAKTDQAEPSNVITLDQVKAQNDFSTDRNFTELLHCMLLCNDTKVTFEEEKLQSIGDPTEVALVHYGYNLGFNKENIEGQFPRVNEIPFDSDRKLMTTFHTVGAKTVAYTKGAVDSILSRCNRILDNGKIRRITNADKEKILQVNAQFGAEALRNLAFAAKMVEKVGRPTSANTEFDLCFLGLVGMIDPPRAEVKDAIKTCKQAGITTIMITGDHKDTAFAIAKELGICSDQSAVITGQELSKIDDEAFAGLVEKYRVYARVSPEHKVKIVKALKANNKIVAMTGDGVNDAPSIKAADIGVGMGITGTDVTKEAADIILTDDNFATIVGAVKGGRRIYDTILKILIFLLGTSMAELFTLSVITIFFRDQNFFSPALILYINFVSDTFVGLALGFEKAEKDIMQRKPQKNGGSLFKGDVGLHVLLSAAWVAAVLLVLYSVLDILHFSSQEVTTICFLYLVLTELFHAYNLKSKTQSLFSSNPFDNKWLNLSFLASALLTILIVVLPLGQFDNAMGLTIINWWQWLLALGLAIMIVPYYEIVKLIMRNVVKRKNK